jgi:hypothetical protein
VPPAENPQGLVSLYVRQQWKGKKKVQFREKAGGNSSVAACRQDPFLVTARQF